MKNFRLCKCKVPILLHSQILHILIICQQSLLQSTNYSWWVSPLSYSTFPFNVHLDASFRLLVCLLFCKRDVRVHQASSNTARHRFLYENADFDIHFSSYTKPYFDSCISYPHHNMCSPFYKPWTTKTGKKIGVCPQIGADPDKRSLHYSFIFRISLKLEYVEKANIIKSKVWLVSSFSSKVTLAFPHTG